MGTHDGRVEHLDETSGIAHRRERVEEGFEYAGFAQPVEAFPHAVPGTEALGQGAPANVLDTEDVERFEKKPVVGRLRPRWGRQARKTTRVCVQSCSVIRVYIDLAFRDTGRRKSQTGRAAGSPNRFWPKFEHMA